MRPTRVSSHSGARYFLFIIDDFSRKVWTYILKQKSEAFEKFKEWKVLVETQTNRKVKKLGIDNGSEFCSKEFNQFCRKQGIERHKTIRGIPQQNGLAERMNRTIMEMVRCIIFGANYSTHF